MKKKKLLLSVVSLCLALVVPFCSACASDEQTSSSSASSSRRNYLNDDTSSGSTSSATKQDEINAATVADKAIENASSQQIASTKINLDNLLSYSHGLNYFRDPTVLQYVDVYTNTSKLDVDISGEDDENGYFYYFNRNLKLFSYTEGEEVTAWTEESNVDYRGETISVLAELLENYGITLPVTSLATDADNAESETPSEEENGEEEATEKGEEKKSEGDYDFSISMIESYLPKLPFKMLNSCVLSLGKYADALSYKDNVMTVNTNQTAYVVAQKLLPVVESATPRTTLADLMEDSSVQEVLTALFEGQSVQAIKDDLLVITLILGGITGNLNEDVATNIISLFSIQPTTGETVYHYLYRLISSKLFLPVLGGVLGTPMSGYITDVSLTVLLGENWQTIATVLLKAFTLDGLSFSLQDVVDATGISFTSILQYVMKWIQNNTNADIAENAEEKGEDNEQAQTVNYTALLNFISTIIAGSDNSSRDEATILSQIQFSYSLPVFTLGIGDNYTVTYLSINVTLDTVSYENQFTSLKITLEYSDSAYTYIDISQCNALTYAPVLSDGVHTEEEQSILLAAGEQTVRLYPDFKDNALTDFEVWTVIEEAEEDPDETDENDEEAEEEQPVKIDSTFTDGTLTFTLDDVTYTFTVSTKVSYKGDTLTFTFTADGSDQQFSIPTDGVIVTSHKVQEYINGTVEEGQPVQSDEE